MSIEIPIPLDEDGFIELECDYCKGRFMLHESVYSDDSNFHFFCPLCGLPNDINTFFCPEVLELAQQKVINYMNDEIKRQLLPSVKKFNRKGLIKMSLKMPDRQPEKELYAPLGAYSFFHQDCCDINVKALELDVQIGIYCPICGRSTL